MMEASVLNSYPYWIDEEALFLNTIVCLVNWFNKTGTKKNQNKFSNILTQLFLNFF